MRRLVLLLALAAAGCKSSAPFMIPAAVINTGIAVGFAAAQRSMGGCYATCTNGTACNPQTGFCEKLGSDCSCPAGQVCLEATGGVTQCVPYAPMILSERQQAEGPPIIIKPEPGVVPTLPARH